MVARARVPKSGGGRGGSRNYTKPRVCQEQLVDKISSYVKSVGTSEAFQLFEYETLWSNCAVRPKSLGKLGQFILCLLKVDPSAQGLPYSDYKAAFHSVLSKWPEAKPKQGSMSDAAGDLADRCIVIINHARKMSVGMQAEESWNKILEVLPHKSKWLVDLTQARDIIQASSVAQPSPSPSPSPPRSAAASPPKSANMHASELTDGEEASQDSDGFPTFNFLDDKVGRSRSSEDTHVEGLAAEFASGRPPRASKKKPAAAGIDKKWLQFASTKNQLQLASTRPLQRSQLARKSRSTRPLRRGQLTRTSTPRSTRQL